MVTLLFVIYLLIYMYKHVPRGDYGTVYIMYFTHDPITYTVQITILKILTLIYILTSVTLHVQNLEIQKIYVKSMESVFSNLKLYYIFLLMISLWSMQIIESVRINCMILKWDPERYSLGSSGIIFLLTLICLISKSYTDAIFLQKDELLWKTQKPNR